MMLHCLVNVNSRHNSNHGHEEAFQQPEDAQANNAALILLSVVLLVVLLLMSLLLLLLSPA